VEVTGEKKKNSFAEARRGKKEGDVKGESPLFLCPTCGAEIKRRRKKREGRGGVSPSASPTYGKKGEGGAVALELASLMSWEKKKREKGEKEKQSSSLPAANRKKGRKKPHNTGVRRLLP